MSKQVYLKEPVKTVLILILAVSAVFLSVRTIAYTEYMTGSQTGNPGLSDISMTADYSAAITPLVIVVSAPDVNSGELTRLGVKYGDLQSSRVFERLSGTLREALGTASETVAVDNSEFYAALLGEGFFIDFQYELPVDAIASWLGVSVSQSLAGLTARRVLLHRQDGYIAIYCMGKSGCHRSVTPLEYKNPLTGFEPSGAIFALESDLPFDNLDGAFVITRSLPRIPELTAHSPFASGLDVSRIFEVFDMSGYIASSYTESDGSVVYVEGDKTLRAYPSGRVDFSYDLEENKSVPEVGMVSDIWTAYEVSAGSIGSYCGFASVTLTGAEYDSETGIVTARFGYLADGIPIELGSSPYAAEVKLKNGVVYGASLYFREYAVSGEVSQLPDYQGAALIGASLGGEPRLVYADAAQYVEPCWISAADSPASPE